MTYTFQVRITTEKDIRRNFMEMIVRECLEELNVSIESTGVEKPVSVEITSKK